MFLGTFEMSEHAGQIQKKLCHAQRHTQNAHLLICSDPLLSLLQEDALGGVPSHHLGSPLASKVGGYVLLLNATPLLQSS